MKQKKVAKRRQYSPPIAWERFGHMIKMLHMHIHGLNRQRSIQNTSYQMGRLMLHKAGEEMDEATALEIADALYRLRAIYSEQALRCLLPNKRVKATDLQDAANAAALVDIYGVEPADAMQAVTGNPRKVERDTLARTLRNRREWMEKIPTSPQWEKVKEARELLRKKKEE